MDFWIGLIIGLIFGCAFGVFTIALLSANRHEEDEIRRRQSKITDKEMKDRNEY